MTKLTEAQRVSADHNKGEKYDNTHPTTSGGMVSATTTAASRAQVHDPSGPATVSGWARVGWPATSEVVTAAAMGMAGRGGGHPRGGHHHRRGGHGARQTWHRCVADLKQMNVDYGYDYDANEAAIEHICDQVRE